MPSIKTDQSQALFARAQQRIPGGVNSPVRAFMAVGGQPRFIARAAGSRIWDEDGNCYIDYVNSWGPAVLGHAPEEVTEAGCVAAHKGLSFGASTAAETELAELINDCVPGIEKIRMVNSGTEAVMSALRLARGYTGRDDIVKFAGCYHGHVDSMLVAAGSGALSQGVPNSAGVPSETVRHTFVAQYNDLESVKAIFAEKGDSIAAVIVEPVAANMGLVLPQEGFLQGLRDITRAHGALLIFDEVITGFRLGLAGAQGVFGIAPDLSCFGKIIGGGMPVGAYGGRAEIMDCVAPLGEVYQAGTLSGNPVAMAAGLATIRALQAKASIYRDLAQKSEKLARGLYHAAQRHGIAVHTPYTTGLAGIFFLPPGTKEVTGYADVQQTDAARYAEFFHGMLQRGVNFAPSAFEAIFLCAAHTNEDIQQTIDTADEVFAEMTR